MKNIFIAAALLVLLSANASQSTFTHSVTLVENQEKEYKKIDVSKVTEAILKEIRTKYEGYTISEAFVSEDNTYKLSLTKDTTALKVYYTGAGEFVKEEK